MRAVGVIHWGLMTTVFCVSHLAFMLALPDLPGLKNSGVSLLFYLVVLTQLNDTAHYLVNKRFGRHAVLATVRPGLSVEGMVAGTGLTALAAVALAPWFTPFTWPQAVTAGLMIGLFGFIGFVAITAVERDLGVSESGHFLPGHGGLLERLDSLMFTAPLFFISSTTSSIDEKTLAHPVRAAGREPIIVFWLGLTVRHRERLPQEARPSSPATTTVTSIRSHCCRCFRWKRCPMCARSRRPTIS